jgi:uncharacterized membrane protein
MSEIVEVAEKLPDRSGRCRGGHEKLGRENQVAPGRQPDGHRGGQRGFWSSLIGLIFLNPLLGLAMGAAAGAVSGALTDVGIDDRFMKDLAATMQPGSSALFVLARRATPDKVLEELQGTGGTILQTSLSHEDEAKLQAALSAASPTKPLAT